MTSESITKTFYRWIIIGLVLHAVTFCCVRCNENVDAEGASEDRGNLTGDRRELSPIAEGRTFAVKRLQFMLLPLMYKMGVITTMLTVLVVLSLKSVLIGIILLILKLVAFAAKFASFAQPSHAAVAAPWSPPAQPIHVHVHNDGSNHHSSHEQIYPAASGWDYYSVPSGSSSHLTSGIGGPSPYYYKG